MVSQLRHARMNLPMEGRSPKKLGIKTKVTPAENALCELLLRNQTEMNFQDFTENYAGL